MAYNTPQDSRVFSGVMDQDSANWAIRDPDYRIAINLDNTVSDGDTGSQNNIPGDKLVANPYLKVGINKTIGYFEDVAGMSIIYLVYNSNGYHSIFRWFSKKGGQDGVIEKVYQVPDPSQYDVNNPDPLNFREDKRVTGINLRGNMLFWTDAFNQPRSMNIDRANETGKKREWKFYYNRQNLGNAVTYGMEVYDANGAIVEIVGWASSASSLSQRIKDAASQLQAATSIRVTAYATYLGVAAVSPGQYFIKLIGLSQFPDRILADNFYPDYTNSSANSYPALPSLFFNRIKNPPFKAPSTQYNVQASQASLIIDPFVVPTTVGGNGYAGLSGAVNSIPGLVLVTGSERSPAINGVWPSHFPPFAYLTSTAPITISIRIQVSIEVKYQVNNAQVYNPIVVFSNSINTFPSQGTVLVEGFASNTPGILSADITFQQTINPGDLWGIYFEGMFSNSELLGGNIAITEAAASVEPTELSKKSLMARVKNTYELYQNSVYSQSTSVILPIFRYTQDKIQIDLWEKWVEILPWCSTLIQKTLAISDDGGTTWNDVKTLEPYEFVCQNDSTYFYTGKEGYSPIASSTALLQYHDVPLVCSGQELTDNRVWDAGIEKGYDKPQVEMEIQVNQQAVFDTTPINSGSSVECFRPKFRGYVGIVYYDDADRKCGVCVTEQSKVEIPDYYPGLINNPGWIYGLNIKIYNEPPAWATKYRIVRTKDLSAINYLLFAPNNMEAIDKDGNVVAGPAGAVYWRLNLDNIAEYVNVTQRGAILEYTYQVGDRIRFIAPLSTSIVPASPLFDAEIVQYDPTTNSVFISYNTALTKQDYLIEIYSPMKSSEINTLEFYEIGDTFEIKSRAFNGIVKKYHTGSPVYTNAPGVSADQRYGPSPTNFVIPAIVETYHGGAYARMRKIIVDTPANTEYNTLIWSNFANELTQSKFDGTYRPNIIDLPGRTNLYPYGQFSNQWVSDRWFGLNENEPANFFSFDFSYGRVLKLVVINNNVLKLVFSNGYQASIYVNQGVIRQSQGGENLVTVSDQVAGQSNIIQRSLGTINPESVVINDEGDVFGWDEKAGMVWRASGNGLIPVSAYKMMATFNNYSLQRKAVDGYSQAPCVYDIFRDQYILTLLPVNPFAQVKSWANINIGDLNTNYTYGICTLQLGPTVFYNAVPSTNIMADLASAINAVAGWTTGIANDGGLKVIAPDETYNDQEFVLTINYTLGTKVFKYTLSGGKAQGQGTTTPAITLFFSKAKQGWPAYYTFAPECYGRLRNRIVQFNQGEMWLYREGYTRNNFQGVQYDSSIRWTVNRDYPKVKVPLAVWYRAQGNFGCKVTVTPSANYPTGQETEMTPSHFQLLEDGYFSAVLRNRLYLTPAFPTTDQAWVNGNEIRSDSYDVELYNTETSPVRLDSAKTTYFYSETS